MLGRRRLDLIAVQVSRRDIRDQRRIALFGLRSLTRVRSAPTFVVQPIIRHGSEDDDASVAGQSTRRMAKWNVCYRPDTDFAELPRVGVTPTLG